MPDRISIRIIVILWVRLGLHNLGRVLRLPNRPVALFRSDAVIVFGRIPLVGRSVERLVQIEGRSVALPPVALFRDDLVP